jgi:amidase
VGVLAEGFGWDHADSAVEATVREAVEGLADRGVGVVEVSVPAHREKPALVGVTAGLGAAGTARQGGVGTTTPGWHWPAGRAAVAAALGDPPATLSPAVVATLLFTRETDAAEGWRAYARAKNRVLALGRAYDARLDGCDALALPTSPVMPVEYDPDAGRLERVRRLATLPVNTGSFNQTGHPAVSVPCGTVDGLPVGLQLVGRRFDESTLFTLAAAVADAAPAAGRV